ncbi:hypothetical protein TWF102_004384 [Orbilia oligospora]|uniref:Kelch repeat-containing protein n=2 Tax=Orbilia oligospora TaxID=2813651 RepID=A0A7C8JCT0_ORBOL|nr:hypothetical protein TWF706_009689 [Orbilia oligospora]KAF3102716.1 hypothetical protein TWF102_004384 [Orbilia oligospora]KAF3110430.1 hypothetical protein TWF103_004704 [Orbilia oligospora]KAF3130199.1 hypothetical protein TWF703_008366 [Orbilia oligospora]KAF3136326.1 hypothetical protein TWF594_007962 [Orbilia oligospora]
MVRRKLIFATLPALGHALAVSTAEMGISRRENGPLERREIGIRAMCSWELPSSAIIRDQLYINGGRLKRANITGTGAPQIEVNDIPTLSYYLNLGTGFNTTEVPFQTIDTPFAQVTAGFMAANDNSFWLYGGLLADTDSIQSFPADDNVQVYDVYRQGPERIWQRGWQVGPVLSNDVNRYVAGGAGVNVRELNTTYYFSGARNKNWGEIRGPGPRPRYSPNVTSSQFISADLSEQVRTKWTNTTLPTPARPRVNAEMVYVPAGKLGALVVIGGVTRAEWQSESPDEDPSVYQAAVNRAVATGPNFLQTVDIYDINDKQWYLQNTTGDIPPTGLAQFCATVATSEDGKSHHIYIYGGYPGQSLTRPIPYYDDVYVLSIPAFEWIKVLDGSPSTARKGHRCVKPLPDQMFIIGGAPSSPSRCIDIVRVLNLNKLEFMSAYDPSVYEQYKVPQPIRDVVGGDENGSATKTASRWAAPTLEAMFVTESPPQRAATFYPYPSEPANSTPSVSIIQTKSETPKFVYPVVAVCIVVVLAIVGGCIAFFCIRRRKQRKAAKDAGNEQFQNQEKDTKGAAYPEYPADPQQQYGSYGSMSTIAPAYATGDQYSGNPQIIFELPAEPKGPVELDAGAVDYAKLGVIDENRANDAFSIVPTPATERSDPISAASRNASTRTRRSVFSEATSPIDNIPGSVSPLTPDPEIAGNPGETPITPAEFSWWRKQSFRGGAVARKLSNFSIKTISRTNTGLSRSNTAQATSTTPPTTVAPTTVAPTATPADVTPPEPTTQEQATASSAEPANNTTEEAAPTPPPAPTTTTTTTPTTNTN